MGRFLCERRVAGKGDRHEQRGVVDPKDGVRLLALKVEHMTGPQFMRDAVSRKIEPALQAMDRDLSTGLVGGNLLAPGDHQPDDFQVLGLDQGGRPRAGPRRSERTDIDDRVTQPVAQVMT